MSELDRITAAIDRMTERQQWTLAGYIEGYTERLQEEQKKKEARRKAREKRAR